MLLMLSGRLKGGLAPAFLFLGLCSWRHVLKTFAGQDFANAPLVDIEVRSDLVLQEVAAKREALDKCGKLGGECGASAARHYFLTLPAPLCAGRASV